MLCFLHVQQKSNVAEDEEDELRDAFRQFDRNGDGFITAADLVNLLANFGENLTPEEVAEMIHEADLDGDGRIGSDEFVQMMMPEDAGAGKADSAETGAGKPNDVGKVDDSTATQRAARVAQWANHALIVSGVPRAGLNGAYLCAGEADDAPYGRNPITGTVLYFKPALRHWFISTDMDAAAAGVCCASTPCDAATSCVPEGDNQWSWFDAAEVQCSAADKTRQSILGNRRGEFFQSPFILMQENNSTLDSGVEYQIYVSAFLRNIAPILNAIFILSRLALASTPGEEGHSAHCARVRGRGSSSCRGAWVQAWRCFLAVAIASGR
jgi:hypothetical protein